MKLKMDMGKLYAVAHSDKTPELVEKWLIVVPLYENKKVKLKCVFHFWIFKPNSFPLASKLDI